MHRSSVRILYTNFHPNKEPVNNIPNIICKLSLDRNDWGREGG